MVVVVIAGAVGKTRSLAGFQALTESVWQASVRFPCTEIICNKTLRETKFDKSGVRAVISSDAQDAYFGTPMKSPPSWKPVCWGQSQQDTVEHWCFSDDLRSSFEIYTEFNIICLSVPLTPTSDVRWASKNLLVSGQTDILKRILWILGFLGQDKSPKMAGRKESVLILCGHGGLRVRSLTFAVIPGCTIFTKFTECIWISMTHNCSPFIQISSIFVNTSSVLN